MPKVIVDHSGSCGGYTFEAGVEVELPEDVVKTLGASAQPVEGKKAETEKEEKTEAAEKPKKEASK